MEELSLNEVYGVWYTSFWQTLPGYAILTIIALTVCCLTYLIVRAVNVYRRGTSKDEALCNLRILQDRVSKGQIDLRKVYQELTNIVKSYSQWRYAMPRGMTDYELIVWLNKVECQGALRGDIERIMSDAQAVKFGQFNAPKERILHDIAMTISYIEVAGEPKVTTSIQR
jgi:hypothetical protein